MGYPQMVGFVRENPKQKWIRTGGTPRGNTRTVTHLRSGLCLRSQHALMSRHLTSGDLNQMTWFLAPGPL